MWVDVINHPGYLVNEYGKIKSIKRIVIRKNGRTQKIKERLLSPHIRKDGYSQVNLNRKLTMVHRVVMFAFKGRPKQGYQVNHKDGNKLNNALSNLEYVTASENTQHAYDTGLIIRDGDKHGNKIIDSKKAYIVKKELSIGSQSSNDISKKLNVSIHIINDIKRGKTWKKVIYP